jgi:ABC-type uncharacterized transport system substrate-binding protein
LQRNAYCFGSFTNFHRKQLLELAAKNRLPSICEAADLVFDGGLMSYGPDVLHTWKSAATFVDKILKGAKPADIPVEGTMKFELIINLADRSDDSAECVGEGR